METPCVREEKVETLPCVREGTGVHCAFSGNYPGRNYASLAKKDVGIEDIFNTETLSS